jgi:hypothetical protein
MNRKHLGDALDHRKGSLLKQLQCIHTVHNFAVEPKFPDPPWTDEERALLARLLRVKPAQILRHTADLLDRAKYLDEIKHRGDLFLDPDVGVATHRVTERERYVMPSELKRLLDEAPERLLLVYQHGARCDIDARVAAVCDAVRREVGRCGWCAYQSATVAMLCVARNPARTRAVERHLAEFLRPCAKRWIRGGAWGG